MRKNGSSDDEPLARKRGRPAGKNRVPLTAEERRARNTQYERERRNDKAKAMAELAEAAGFESSISTPELLTKVINQIQNATSSKSLDEIDKLRHINDNLMSQINKLESQLKLHCPEFDPNNFDDNDASDSDDQSTKSYDSVSRSTRARTNKIMTKRKRKNRHEESDSQDSVDVPVRDNDDIHKPKRFKSQLEHNSQEETSRSKTRSSSSSQYAYGKQSSNHCHGVDEVNTLYQSESYEQTYATHHTLQPVSHLESSIAATPMSGDPNALQSGLPSIIDFGNWSAECSANILQQPELEYTPELDYRSLLNLQEPVVNESPIELPPLENFNFLEDGEAEFINDQSEWFDSLYLNSNILENGGNNLVYF